MTSTLSKSDVLEVIRTWPQAGRYLAACSGGVDSIVLLHLMHALREDLPGQLMAVHVDHGISAQREQWSELCVTVCRDLEVPLIQIKIDARPEKGHSPEDLARRLRYRALREQLGSGDILLTAHQADDQAETMMLQLFRGAGPAGLAAMPALQPFEPGWHGRPLLNYTRSQVEDYARAQSLSWVEDDSNVDRRFNRNYLRHEITPRLKLRWPSLTAALNRAARHQASAAQLLTELAQLDLAQAVNDGDGSLRIDLLADLGSARRDNMLRLWIKERDLPIPDTVNLQRIWTEVACARPDAVPCLRWPGAEVRRYRNRLFALAPLPEHDRAASLRWRPAAPITTVHGTLSAVLARGRGIRASACPARGVEVRYRTGGERLRPVGSRHTRALKVLLQEQGIPVWLRDRIPLLFVDEKLAAVAGLWVDMEFAAGPEEEGWDIHWSGMIS